MIAVLVIEEIIGLAVLVGIDRRHDGADSGAADRSLGQADNVVGVVLAAESFGAFVAHHIRIIVGRVGLELAPRSAGDGLLHTVPEDGGDLVALVVTGGFALDNGGEHNRFVKAHLHAFEALSVGVRVVERFFCNFHLEIAEESLDDGFRIFPHIKGVGIGVQIALERVFPLLKNVI